MVKIICAVMRHAEFLHDPERAGVGRNRERNHAVKPCGFEGKSKHLARAFGCQSTAPVPGCDAPAYFDGWHKRRIETGDGQTDKTDEGLIRPQFGGKKAKAVELKALLDAIHHFVGSFGGKQPGQEFHHARVRIQFTKRLPVGISPLPQDEPFGFEAFRHGERVSSAKSVHQQRDGGLCKGDGGERRCARRFTV